jgi:uncharacterized protein YciI
MVSKWFSHSELSTSTPPNTSYAYSTSRVWPFAPRARFTLDGLSRITLGESLQSLDVGYYVVISDQGPKWVDSLLMRPQQDWSGHAEFMNALADDGFVILGGPIGDGTRHRARLIVKPRTDQEVRDRLALDPWAKKGLLTTESIEEWEVLLGDDPDD